MVEPNEARRRFARANGALPADPQEARDLIERLTDGDGADVVIEAVGAAATLTGAFDLVRKRGRIVSVGAHATEQWPMPLARCFADEITLSFAIGDAIRLRPQLFSLIRSGVLDPTVVIEETLTWIRAPGGLSATEGAADSESGDRSRGCADGTGLAGVLVALSISTANSRGRRSRAAPPG